MKKRKIATVVLSILLAIFAGSSAAFGRASYYFKSQSVYWQVGVSMAFLSILTIITLRAFGFLK